MFLKQVYKGQNEFWQYLLTIMLVVIGYFVGQLPITFLTAYAIKKDGMSDESIQEFMDTMDFGLLGIDQNLTLFLLLIMFVVAMISLYLGVTRIHKRPFLSVWTARSSLDFNRIFFAFFVWMGLTFAVEIVGYLTEPENYIFQFQPTKFFILAVIVLLLLPIQTSFEEVFIRGYVMQMVSLLTQHRWVPLLVSSALFGLMHFMNPEVREFGFGTMMSYYIGIAIFLGIMTLLDDGLELAIGVHTATNVYGAMFTTFESSAIKTPALFRLVEVNPQSMAVYSLLASLLFLFIVIKKYNLSDWNKVFGTTDQIEHEIIGTDESNNA